MKSSDIITEFIMNMLESEGGELELKRNELAQQFKEMRGMLDDLGEQTATSAEAKGAGEPVSE